MLSKIRSSLRKKHETPPENYQCPICNRSEHEISSGGGNKKSKWVLDHDHQNNNFRGWLCHTCNMGIGSFSDNIDTLYKAIEYLKND